MGRTSLCFDPSAQAFERGGITLQEHLDNLFAHVAVDGVRHEQDKLNNQLLELASKDPLSGAFQMWILQTEIRSLQQQDVASLKNLVLLVWNSDDTEHLAILDDLIGRTSEESPAIIWPYVVHILIAVAFSRNHMSLLPKLLTYDPPSNTIFNMMLLPRAIEKNHPLSVWTAIINSKWIENPGRRKFSEGWNKLVAIHLRETNSTSSPDFELFIDSLKRHGHKVRLHYIADALSSRGKPVSPIRLTILFRYFPPLDMPTDDVSTGPKSKAHCLFRMAARANQLARLDIMRVLLRAQLDPNWMCDPLPSLAKCSAMAEMHEDCAMERWAHTDRETALHIAAKEGDVNLVEFLLDHGAKIYLKDGLGQTPLSCAKSRAQADVVALLEAKQSIWKWIGF